MQNDTNKKNALSEMIEDQWTNNKWNMYNNNNDKKKLYDLIEEHKQEN